jgi:hypothetical protein
MSNVKMQMIECKFVETWPLRGKEVEVEVEKHGWQMT